MLMRISGIFLLFSLLFLISCRNRVEPDEREIRLMKKKNDKVLNRILTEKMLVATTEYNSTAYFIYRGEPMGYQYELLKSFSSFLGVKLEIKTISSEEAGLSCLANNECDLIALGLAVTKERNQQVEFSLPLSQSRQVLIQCKPKGWQKMYTADQINAHLIRNPLYLSGRTIHVQKNSVFKNRLQNLSGEIGSDINIVEITGASVEELIGMVAKREIEFTVCEENVALVIQKYYPEIDVATPVSFPQNIAWAVPKDAYGILDTLNYWLDKFKQTRESVFIYNKYFKNTGRRFSSKGGVLSAEAGKISPYDEIIKKHSATVGWDWRLLASLIYQESRFYPDTISWSGAFGLMQLMPNTASKYEIDSLSTPESQINAGSEYISLLDRQFAEKGVNESERIKFVLAAYNVGIAHVFDAQRLAEKNGKDPLIWENNVEVFILSKSKPEFYNDSVVRYGYCRGEECYNFVNEVMNRFEHYKNLIGDQQ
jgi:membrane-bound lytic murein transglycosylase F